MNTIKNILTTLLLIISFTASAQLNETAKRVKSNLPIDYELLKKYAENKWNDDYEMIVYTINNQAEAMLEMVELKRESDYDEGLMVAAFLKWKDKSIEIEGEYFVDYEMLVYTYKNQLEAKNSY